MFYASKAIERQLPDPSVCIGHRTSGFFEIHVDHGFFSLFGLVGLVFKGFVISWCSYDLIISVVTRCVFSNENELDSGVVITR